MGLQVRGWSISGWIAAAGLVTYAYPSQAVLSESVDLLPASVLLMKSELSRQSFAQAQSPDFQDPNSDRFLQPQAEPQPVAPEEATPILPAPAPSPTPGPLPTDEAVRISVQRIEVIGSTVFDEADFAPIVTPFEGQSLTLEELRGIADQITQLYLDRGYLTSRAVLVDQVVTDGVIQFRVVEGQIERIDVEGNHHVNAGYIRERVALGTNAPLNQADLEDQLRLLRLNPLFENVEASLRAGTGLGQSILTVRVIEADPFAAVLSADNLSPPSVGSERFGAALSYRSLTGWGDELFASYYRSSTGGSNVWDIRYRIPVNPMEGTIELRTAPSDYRITDPAFSALDIEGNATEYEVSFRQPLTRSPREEFALSAGLNHRDGSSLISDFEIDDTSVSVFRFGQDWVRRDVRGAWALRSQFNFGNGLFDADTGAEPNSLFFSWFAQAQRVQILNPDHLLIMQADLQLTPDALPSSQQFVIGGGESVRGYEQNIRLGDNGFRISVEDRITVLRNEAGESTVQFAPFVDLGAVWNAADNPVEEPEDTFLAGVGLGFLWQPFAGVDIRVDWALPLVDLPDAGNNAQDQGFYFNVKCRF